MYLENVIETDRSGKVDALYILLGYTGKDNRQRVYKQVCQGTISWGAP